MVCIYVACVYYHGKRHLLDMSNGNSPTLHWRALVLKVFVMSYAAELKFHLQGDGNLFWFWSFGFCFQPFASCLMTPSFSTLPVLIMSFFWNRKTKGRPMKRSKNVRKMKAIAKAISNNEITVEKGLKKDGKTTRTQSAKKLYEWTLKDANFFNLRCLSISMLILLFSFAVLFVI